MKKLILSFFLVTFVILNLGVGISLAGQPATIATISPGDYGLPSSSLRLSNLINDVVKWVLIIAGPACLIAIIYGGMRYAFAGGDESKVEDAKKIIKYALIGTAFIIGAYALTGLITNVIQGNLPVTPDFE